MEVFLFSQTANEVIEYLQGLILCAYVNERKRNAIAYACSRVAMII